MASCTKLNHYIKNKRKQVLLDAVKTEIIIKAAASE